MSKINICVYTIEFIYFMKRLIPIFLEDKVDYIQNGISIASCLLNYRLLNYRQRLLFNNFGARLIALRASFQNDFFYETSFIPASFKITYFNRLHYFEFLSSLRYFFIEKKKGLDSFFSFSTIYQNSFFNLCNMLVLPANETKFNLSFQYFRPYRNCYDVFFYIKKFLTKYKNFNYYFELKNLKFLTNLSKIWLMKNFPLISNLAQKVFSRNFPFSSFTTKNIADIFMEDKERPFEITIFSYMLNDLV